MNISVCFTSPIQNGESSGVQGRKKQFITKSGHSSLIMIYKGLDFLTKYNWRKDMFPPDA